MQEGDQAPVMRASLFAAGMQVQNDGAPPCVVFHRQRMALIAENGLLSSPVSTMRGLYRQGSLREGFQNGSSADFRRARRACTGQKVGSNSPQHMPSIFRNTALVDRDRIVPVALRF